MIHINNKTRAFTLIDILVSISIISFLSSIVIFNVTEGKTKAQDAQMKIESAQVATTVEMFKLDNDGKTPISVQMDYFAPLGIVPGEMYQEGTPQYETVMNKLVEEGYISEIPTSPDGDSYAYGETTDGTQAMFVAKLSSETNISGNTQNSCSIIRTSTQPENCLVEYNLNCNQVDDSKLCIVASIVNARPITNTFCPIYNTNGDFNTSPVCDCVDGELSKNSCYEKVCDTYGSFIEYRPSQYQNILPDGSRRNLLCRPPVAQSGRVTCDLPTDQICDGSSNSDYCTCI